jgi:hypothetical protein
VHTSMVSELYLQNIQENAPEFYNPSHQTLKLKEKIIRHFQSKIQFYYFNNKSELLYSSDLHMGAAVGVAFESATSESKHLEDAAMVLHRQIIQAQYASKSMPWPPSAAYLQSPVCGGPDVLKDFLAVVMTGKPGAHLSGCYLAV